MLNIVDNKNQIGFNIYKRDSQPDELDTHVLTITMHNCDTISWDFHFEKIMNLMDRSDNPDLDEMYESLGLYCSLEPPEPTHISDGIYEYKLIF